MAGRACRRIVWRLSRGVPVLLWAILVGGLVPVHHPGRQRPCGGTHLHSLSF